MFFHFEGGDSLGDLSYTILIHTTLVVSEFEMTRCRKHPIQILDN